MTQGCEKKNKIMCLYIGLSIFLGLIVFLSLIII
jgi:hypothetical protein